MKTRAQTHGVSLIGGDTSASWLFRRRLQELQALASKWPCGVTRIGRIEPLAYGVVVKDEKRPVDPSELKGYDHFA
jgi:thiamine monophosphate kinase